MRAVRLNRNSKIAVCGLRWIIHGRGLYLDLVGHSCIGKVVHLSVGRSQTQVCLCP